MAGILAFVLMLPMAAPAAAAAPGNDDFVNAATVSTLPFDEAVDFSEATTEVDEPLGCDNGYGLDRTVWYAWTADHTGAMTVAMEGGWGAQTVAVYGPFTSMPGDFASLGTPQWCVFDSGWDYSLNETVQADELYVFQFAIVSSWSTFATFHLNQGPPPPGNDNLADASVIDGLPFDDYPDLSEATVESGEDLCSSGADRTVWYNYTPDADGTIAVTLFRDYGDVYGRVYMPGESTGITPNATGSDCFSNQSGPVRLGVTGGETYLIQVGDVSWYGGSEPVHLAIEAGPDPLVVAAVVDPIAWVQRVGGVAYLNVTVTCNHEADFWVYSTLRQKLTRSTLADARGDGGGTCSPDPTVMQLAFADEDAAFAPGSALFSGHLDAWDGWTSFTTDGSLTVKMRYMH